MPGPPISSQGKENTDPTCHVSYPLSVAQNGLRSHLNSSRSGVARVSPVNFDFRETACDCGRAWCHALDCGSGDRSEHRSARRGSSQLISSRGEGSQGDNPFYHEITWARLAARASELRVRIKSWRAW
eukprot:6194130-Pleurochrysis_carterae.AAC.1